MSEFRGTGGPPPGQFLQALQSITTALNGQSTALLTLAGGGSVPISMITLSEIAVPPAPPSGAILFCDAADHHTKIINHLGVVTTIAP